jgi:hypothetical protein
MDRRIDMPKKEKTPWLLLSAFAAGLWWMFSGTASASTPATTTVSAGAQKYMNQIMAAQNAFTTGTMSPTTYNLTAGAVLLAAATDPACTGQDLATLHGVAGV